LKLFGTAREQPQDVGLRETEMYGLREEFVDQLDQPAASDVLRKLGSWFGDKHAATGLVVEDAFVFQLDVGSRDGVWIHHQDPRQLADGR